MPANDPSKVSAIIADAGGRVVGRTRLQKIAYLLTVAGLEDSFSFSYRNFGPYSQELASLSRIGNLLGLLSETENSTSWGGTYSTYSVVAAAAANSSRSALARLAASADAIELELAATAVFLSFEGFSDPWAETARRKPEKSENGKIDRARALLHELRAVPTPRPLPAIA